MEGFFTKKEVESSSRPDGKLYTCTSCGLYKNVHSPKMKPYGNFKKRIMNIGEAPGEREDAKGLPWQGKTGKLLYRTYKELGIDLFEDCININACYCRPTDEGGNNRTPTNLEIESCRRVTLQYIKHYKPQVIILLGNSAIYSLIGHRWKKDLGGITKWRGFTIPDQDFKAWICPTFHPSYIERSFFSSVSNREQDSIEEVIWQQDLKQAFGLIKTPVPEYKEPEIKIIKDLSVLDSITGGLIAFDYETTGIKPHAPGHQIVCCAVAVSKDLVYAFMMPQSRKERQPFLDLLANPNVGKIAQNMKFEDTWSWVRLRQHVENWHWDTMLATHVLDNRQGITGLKFQVYVQFGIVDYSSELDLYLKDSAGGGNDFNKILELIKTPEGIKKLLTYCAMDSIYEFRLATQQIEFIELDILPF